MNVDVLGIGILGPGLEDWSAARSILTGLMPHTVRPTVKPIPHILPNVERRRSSEAARLTIKVADDALTMSDLPRDEVATVFTSSDGDGDITDKICESMAGSPGGVSPTLFHNSVYNAPAGYWSIGTGSRRSSTSLCAFDYSFAAGLLEAAAHTTIEQEAVLLVGYDLPFPEPLRAVRNVAHSLAVAFVLAPPRYGASLMRWWIELESPRPQTGIPDAIDRTVHANPMARSFPLLSVLASGQPQSIVLDYSNEQSLVVACEA